MTADNAVIEHARNVVARLSAQVAAGIRPLDDFDLHHWRKRLEQLTATNDERPDDAA